MYGGRQEGSLPRKAGQRCDHCGSIRVLFGAEGRRGAGVETSGKETVGGCNNSEEVTWDWVPQGRFSPYSLHPTNSLRLSVEVAAQRYGPCT